MQIFVNDLSGKTLSFEVESSSSIRDIKGLITKKEGIQSSRQRLHFSGKQLLDTKLLSDYDIFNESTLHLSLRIAGGAPKKGRCTMAGCTSPAQKIVGDCSFCEGHFCGKHRLLEHHKCPGLDNCKKESYDRNASKLNAEKTIVTKVN